MNKRLLSVFLFALVISAGASLLLYKLLAGRLASQPKVSGVKVVVAARTLNVGTLIQPIDVREADWPADVPPQAIAKVEDVIGRGVIATVYEREPLLESRLAPKGAGAGLAATIPSGMRAVAVRVNDVVGVAGFVVPGMRVDVLISGMPPNAPQGLGTQTKTLLQNIEVLSAGQNIQKDAEGKPVTVPVVNLLVTPEQAEVLSLASNDTRIQFVLRNPLDVKEAKTPGTALARLFSGERLKVPEPVVRRVSRPKAPPQAVVAVKQAPPPPIVVEVLSGSARVKTTFATSEDVRQ